MAIPWFPDMGIWGEMKILGYAERVVYQGHFVPHSSINLFSLCMWVDKILRTFENNYKRYSSAKTSYHSVWRVQSSREQQSTMSLDWWGGFITAGATNLGDATIVLVEATTFRARVGFSGYLNVRTQILFKRFRDNFRCYGGWFLKIPKRCSEECIPNKLTKINFFT